MEQRPSSVSQLHQTRSRGEKAGQRTERHHPSTRNIHITHITDPETVDTAGSSKINFQSHLCRLTVFTFVRHLEHSFIELRPPLIITHLGQGPATVRCICPDSALLGFLSLGPRVLGNFLCNFYSTELFLLHTSGGEN